MIPLLPLQTGMCDASKSGPEYLTEFEFIKAVSCTYTEVGGLFVVGMMIMTAVTGHIYLKTGSLILPFGIIMLGGGSLLTIVAPPAVAAAGLIVLTTGAAAITFLYYRYSR